MYNIATECQYTDMIILGIVRFVYNSSAVPRVDILEITIDKIVNTTVSYILQHSYDV